MVYLLLKITLCLLLAGILGAIIGWLLKHIFTQKHHNEQQQRFDVERKQHKKDLRQVESNWHAKYQSLNTTHNKIQGLFNISTQKNIQLSESVKTTQQTLNDQGEILTHLQNDMRKLGKTKDVLQNKNSLLAQEVVNLRNENKQIATLEDNITQLNKTQSLLETTLKETEAANEAANTNLLKKYHDLEKIDVALKSELNTVMGERDHAKHTLAQLKITTEKEQQKSNELIIEKQQNKNNTTITTLRNTLKKIEKDNIALKEEVSILQQTAEDIPKLKSKSSALEKDKQKLEEILQATHNDVEKTKQFETTINLLKIDNSILKKDNQENNQQNIKINRSLSHMTSEIERYKRYLIESEKIWATKVYKLQTQLKAVDNKQHQNDAPNKLQEKIDQLNDELSNTKALSKNNKKQQKEKINKLQEKINQLNTELDNTKSSSAEEKNQLQEKTNQLDNKQEAAQQDYIDLREEHEALKLELKQLHQQKPKIAAINKARADDLQKIKGIGKHNERILNKLGITHYSQIADFTQQDEEKFGKELGVFASRINQEAWVGQAKILHQDKYGKNVSTTPP